MGKWRYGVILDAGSSGTRVHIYKWKDHKELREHGTVQDLNSLPVLVTKDKWTKKTHPGVSSFAQKPSRIGPDHLEPLLQRALEYVPEDEVEETPIFLLATAGMRLVEKTQQDAIMKEICSYTRANTKFLLPDCDLHIQIIPGETEGLYGWIAVNYLLGGFDSPENHAHGKDHHTYGFLDMGGASAQIAFAPNKTEAAKHSNDLTLLRMRKLNGKSEDYKVFVTTWLEFGANEARRKYVEKLVKDAGAQPKEEIGDPCLPKGMRLTTKGEVLDPDSTSNSGMPSLIGTGQFDLCLKKTFPLLEKDAPCPDDPCLIHGVHVPSIDFDVNHFVGISEYWHTTHEIFEMAHKDKSYDFATYQNRVKEFCEQDWSTISKDIAAQKWGKKVDEQTAYEVCFKASWLINILHDGIGIPRVGLEGMQDGSGLNGTKEVIQQGKEKGFLDPFQAVNKIQDTEVSWTLGKMVLYASSEIPPVEDQSLPVGFGSNEPGIPKDFHYPGVKHHANDDESFTSDFRDSLFSGDSTRRIPGVILFLLIVIVAIFVLCGRDRRARIYRKFGINSVSSTPGRKRRNFFIGKLPFFSRYSPIAYERVLEDGPLDEDIQNGFELGAVNSNDSDASDSPSEPSKRGARKASGWTTPSTQNGAGEIRPSSRNGISAGTMDRTGLAVRTESVERLNGHGGGRSRTGSPVKGQLGKRA